MLRVAILISGGGSNMAALVRSAGDAVRPVLVLSSDPGAAGLGRAAALGVPTAAVDARAGGRAAFEDALSEALDAAGPDLLCLAGFMRILSPGFVAARAGRILNIHPSLLPRYPGLHTHARALAAGDAWAGATVHEVTGTLDGGPILGQARVPVLPGDTAAGLAARVLTAEHRLYPAVLARVAAGNRARLNLSWPDKTPARCAE